MKEITSILALGLGLFFPSFSVAAENEKSFDGDWDVTLSCPKSPEGAMAFSYEFDAKVKDGVLHGERGTADEPGWMQLDGPIKSDGSAALIADGITNIPNYTVYHVKKGTPYKHAVSAQFDGTHGTGSWITVRTCTFTFDKK